MFYDQNNNIHLTVLKNDLEAAISFTGIGTEIRSDPAATATHSVECKTHIVYCLD